MGDLRASFDERLTQIDAYLDLLDSIQSLVGSGSRRDSAFEITEQQQRILHSSVYLQLYNLVESTITRCIDAVSEAAAEDGRWHPKDLSEEMRRQWVRATIRSDQERNDKNQLEGAMHLCNWLVEARPLAKFRIAKGSGGNWDDMQIEEFTKKRIGLELSIPAQIKTEAKRKRRNDRGALGLIKSLRNDLAHGRVSFEECGAEDTVSDLRELKTWTAAYLAEVVREFEDFISSYRFLAPSQRPTDAA